MNDRATASDSLSSLLLRVAAGDALAFRRIYDWQAPRLYATALRITRQDPLACDAVQDTFLQIWRNAHCFDPVRGTAQAWVLSLARYRAMDIVRGRVREVPADDLPEPVDDTPDVLARLAEASDVAALHASLGRLRADRRRLVLLVYVEGLTYAEAAARMRMPVGTAKSSLRRSLRALRRSLENAAGAGRVGRIGHQVLARQAPLAGRIPCAVITCATVGRLATNREAAGRRGW